MKTTEGDQRFKQDFSIAKTLARNKLFFLICTGLCFVVIFVLYKSESEFFSTPRFSPSKTTTTRRNERDNADWWKMRRLDNIKYNSDGLPENTSTSVHSSSNTQSTTVFTSASSTNVRRQIIGMSPNVTPSECLSVKKNFSYVPPIRLVHFDLKGAPPKVEYFKDILPILKASGATGLLMEYEDTFPFWGALSPVAAPYSYTKEDILSIQSLAEDLELEVIPLVQTFGHMEFVLKLPQFKHLRESKESASALCPLNHESFQLVAEIIDQIMSLHPKSRWLHIGCDEVFYMGLCKKCNKYVYQKDILYLQHVTKIARLVKKKYEVVPIIWDDMIRRTSSRVLQSSGVGSLVEPMVWVYAEDVPSFFFPSMWHRYKMTFKNIWAASAFKGAFGRELVVPNAQRHLRNHISWLSAIATHSRKPLNFRGLALTGWQRYEHFGPLCELLPVGIPSLVLNLLTVSHGCYWDGLIPKMKRQLQCSQEDFVDNFQIQSDPLLLKTMKSCTYPGSSVFQMASKYMSMNESVSTLFNEICHLKTHRVNIEQIQKDLYELIISLNNIYYDSRTYLSEIYDMFTVTEWVTQNLKPLGKKTSELWSILFNITLDIEACARNGDKKASKREFMTVPEP